MFTGKLITSSKLKNQNGALSIPVSTLNLVSGIYFVNVQAGSTLVTKRLIVNK